MTSTCTVRRTSTDSFSRILGISRAVYDRLRDPGEPSYTWPVAILVLAGVKCAERSPLRLKALKDL